MQRVLKSPKGSLTPGTAIDMWHAALEANLLRCIRAPSTWWLSFGIDISRQRAKSLSEFDNVPFDYVITMFPIDFNQNLF